MLNEKGFNHYEISNFAKKDFNSKHNLNYSELSTNIDELQEIKEIFNQNNSSKKRKTRFKSRFFVVYSI